jgi:formylglycine-generating enzyme required for sulfatase activity
MECAERPAPAPAVRLGGIDFVLIPAGEFTMGANDQMNREMPAHQVYLEAYYIGKYPVTNAEHGRFVEATGHKAPLHWEGGSIPAGKEDHPVVYVSWYDARAYCEWLGAQIGVALRLPTEAEWEKAARGTDGRTFPWGEELDKSRCNSHLLYLNDTTPVGQFSPQGDSPYGVADMAGNVTEWVSSAMFDYPYDPHDGREDLELKCNRLNRGGSFRAFRNSARVCFRTNWPPPDEPEEVSGFRVAFSAR